MSYETGLLVQCEDLQDRLGRVWDNARQVNDPIPFLEYITSPENRNGLQTIINPGQGKTRNINLVWAHRIAEDDVEEVSVRGCENDNVYGEHAEQYSIDTTDLLKSGETIDSVNLERHCMNNADYIAERLAFHMDVIDRKVASKIATQFVALKGEYSQDAQAAFTIANENLVVATKNSDGQIVPGAWEEIQGAALMSGFNGIVGFGGHLLWQHMRLSMAGCCTNFGLDIAEIYRQYGYAFAYDRRLATALGSASTANMIMEPGALQLLNYVATPWKDQLTFRSGYEAFRMTTPAGVEVDVYIKDDCPGVLTINMFANVKLVGIPADFMLAGDNYEGVTFTGGVTVTNP